jgi:HicA-like toxin of HicAB toxin-antitoxin system
VHARHRATLAAIFSDPVRASIAWRDIEVLFRALGATLSEGRGSRIRVELHGADAVFHRPHPQKETDRGAVKSVRRFLREAGVEPP